MNKKLVCLMLVFMVLIGGTDVSAAAKTAKASKNYNKPTAVSIGATVVTDKYNSGYVGFTAKKAGTYKITVSKVTLKERDNRSYGHFSIARLSKYGVYMTEYVRTNDGSEKSSLLLATPEAAKAWKSKDYLKSRYGKIKLKRGDKIRIGVWMSGVSTGKYKYTVNIKKV